MDYRKIGDTYYLRADKGDDLVNCIYAVCVNEELDAVVFSGIGACSSAELQTFDPEKQEFNTREIEGMLELVSLNGNVITDEFGKYFQHTHALFTWEEDGEHRIDGGHLKSAIALYTAEIEIRPVIGGTIQWKADLETGTGFWSFEEIEEQ